MKPTMEILAGLQKNSKENKDEIFTRLFRYLLRPDIYFTAYKNLYANSGAGTRGINDDTADGFGEEKIHKIIESLRSESYRSNPVRRTYIQKKNSKKRQPLGIPTFSDKLVQEALRMILEAIYEPIFLNESHGFRPNRSCHTALKTIKRQFGGARWFVEGDIKSCFDNIDHEILIKILRNKVRDARIIKLIYRFLKAGYLEDWQYRKTYSGTPQGGILSPLLANIYLHEFDKFVIKLKEDFDKPREKQRTQEYYNLHNELKRLSNRMNKVSGEEKTLITHSSECARFLGFDIRVRRSQAIKRKHSGNRKIKKRTLNGSVELLVPLNDKIHRFIFSRKIAVQKNDGTLFPVHRKYLIGSTDLEIVTIYNAELRGICNYYSLAVNFNKLSYFAYLMEYRCLKTIASRHKSSISKVIGKYRCGKKWGIPYETKSGLKIRFFADYSDCKKYYDYSDVISNAAIIYGYTVNTLENRLKAHVCELCGATDSEFYEIHHVNKLKNMKGKEHWERVMIAKKRKTLVVCRHCHRSVIHKI